MKNPVMTEAAIIKYMKEGDGNQVSKAIEAFIKQCTVDMNKSLINKLRKFKLEREEIEDIFQAGMEDFISQMRENKFEGASLKKLKVYYVTICYNKWITEFKKYKRNTEKGSIGELSQNYEAYLKEKAYMEKLFDAIVDVFNQLEGECPEVLRAFYLNQRDRIATIMENLNYTQDQAKKRKKHCLDKLREYLKKHPEQLEIIGG